MNVNGVEFELQRNNSLHLFKQEHSRLCHAAIIMAEERSSLVGNIRTPQSKCRPMEHKKRGYSLVRIEGRMNEEKTKMKTSNNARPYQVKR